MELAQCLKNILHSYLGIVVVGFDQGVESRHILKNSIWLSETKDLVGLIAFTAWSIPSEKAFDKCHKLKYIIGIPPVLGNNMKGMFFEASSFNSDLSKWDVSNVIDMSWMFCNTPLFNQQLDTWDTSNVKNMSCMFFGSEQFNQPLEKWDVSKVEDMSFMFQGLTSFDQDISGWDLSSIIDETVMPNVQSSIP